MQKNNVKSFVCSFICSVLAVATVQRVFFRTPEIKKTNPQASVKVQNISLFEEKSADSDVIAAEAFPQPKIDVSAIDELSLPDPQISVEPVMQTAEAVVPSEPAQAVVYQTAENQNNVSLDLSQASEITLDADEIQELNETKKHINSGIVYADISDTFSSDDDQISNNVQQMAQNDVSLAEEQIPLSENTDALHHKINVTDHAPASQIAMIEPTALINSIEQDNILLRDEKNLADADIKKNEVGTILDIAHESEPEIDETAWEKAEVATEDGTKQSALSGENNVDDPWVMAKGNKYAKNQAVIEEFNKKEQERQAEQINKEIEAEISTLESSSDQTKQAWVDEKTGQPDTDEDTSEDATDSVVSLLGNSVDQQNLSETFSKPLLQTKSTDTKLAYQMIQNILIPIPEDILNDGDLTPDLTSSPDEKELSGNAKSSSQKSNLTTKEKDTGLFKSISSWFSRDKKSDKKSENSSKDGNKALTDAAKEKKNFFTLGSVDDYKPIPAESIMPAELRLSFQPNRAEISGQTLKWIYAFADNARDNNDVYIEVRIDGTSSYVLQQKRLNLLSSIFSSRGVDWRKINPIFTSREPNSFIIRNIRFNNPEDKKGQNMR